MKRTLLLSTVLVALLALFAVSPAAAQGAGEVNVTLEPDDATAEVGAVQSYDVVVEDPDGGILGYDNLLINVDGSVAEIVDFEENHTGNFSLSEIRNGNTTLSLAAATEDDFKQPATNYTLVTFDVEAQAAGQTGVGFNQSANATITDYNDTAYDIQALSGSGLSVTAAPANFQVSNVQPADATVTNGTDIDVSADIENTGGQGTQTVTLSVGGVSATQSVTLADGANTTVTFADVDTGALGPGSYTHTVASANDSASGNLTIQAPASPANFTVEATGTVNPVEGGNIGVTTRVTNVGGTQGTQTVSLSVPSIGTDSTSVTLAAGANTTQLLSVSTGAGDAGSYTATVSTANDTDTDTVVVRAQANFQVSNLQPASATVTNGTAIDVSALVKNTGDVQATQTVTLSVDGFSASKSLTLADGANQTVTFADVDTGALGPGSYTHTVASANDSASGSLTVEAQGTGPQQRLDFNDQTLDDGQNDSDTIVVENVSSGGVKSIVIVTYESTGDLIVAGSSQNGTFSDEPVTVQMFDTSRVPGEHTAHIIPVSDVSQQSAQTGIISNATIANVSDSETATITEPQRATFQVDNLQPTEVTVSNGTAINISADVENTGTAAGTQAITLSVDGVSQTQTTTLAAGANTTVTFSNVDTGVLGPGAYTHTIASANDSASGTLTVEGNFTLEFAEQGIENGTVTVGNVSSDGVEAAVVVTYQEGGDLVVAGQTVGTFDGEDVQVQLDDTGGFPGRHTAHILPADELSNDTASSGVISTATAEAIETAQPGFVSVTVLQDPARDTTGDGLLNDVRGDDTFNILDVQTLFNNLNNPVVQNNAAAFKFSGLGGEVSVIDVQGLFNDLTG
jgi:hypothetical protein